MATILDADLTWATIGGTDGRLLRPAGQTFRSRTMIEVAMTALSMACRKGYTNMLNDAFTESTDLVRLDKEFSLSMADRGYGINKPNWMVMMHFHGKNAAQALRARQHLFFVPWPTASACAAQVHMIDTPVYAKRSCLLMNFVGREPSEIQTNSAIIGLCKQLGLKERARAMRTTPFLGQREEMSQANGYVAKPFKDQIMQPRLRAALSRADNLSTSDRASTMHRLSKSLTEADHDSVTFVLWARQSNECGSRAADAIPRKQQSPAAL